MLEDGNVILAKRAGAYYLKMNVMLYQTEDRE